MKKLTYTFVPLLLILLCPPFAVLYWYTATFLDGSFTLLFSIFQNHGFFHTIYRIWSPVFLGSQIAYTMIFAFATFQILLMKMPIGKEYYGPKSDKGYAPKYRENGLFAYSVTVITYILCSSVFNLFSPTIIFDHMGEIISALTLLSFVFCTFLYFKGRFAPSSPDHSITGNPIFDFYWGTELYPQVAGINLKQFTNCRFGMMSWGIIILSYAAKQHDLYGLSNSFIISLVLQQIYIAKFFLWEKGYMYSLDIATDRAGFYICWGCLVWVPAIYTSVSLFLVHHPYDLSPVVASTILLLGIISIFLNYDIDRQKQIFRASKGSRKVWNTTPIFSSSTYQYQGESHEALLLQSGYWGISRHVHYIPEITAAFAWTLPALFTHAMPYFYVVFLTILLIQRISRIETRSLEKYGEIWKNHQKVVPYKLIPYVW